MPPSVTRAAAVGCRLCGAESRNFLLQLVAIAGALLEDVRQDE